MSSFNEETIDGGYESFQNRVQELNKNESDKDRTVFLFCGDNREDGTNWCPDCRDLDNLLTSLKPQLEKSNTLFIRVKVGQREAWKSPDCQFRTDPALKLTSIPTIMNWKTGAKEWDLKTLLTQDILLSKFGL